MAASLHAYICMFEWILLFAAFIYGCTDSSPFPSLWWVSLLSILLVPIFNEIILNLKYCLCKSRILKPSYSENYNLKECLPIVYSNYYNITAFGIEKCHPFDSTKYQRVYEDLLHSGVIN